MIKTFEQFNEAVDVVVRQFDPAVGIGPNTVTTLDYQPYKDLKKAHTMTWGEYKSNPKKLRTKLKNKPGKQIVKDYNPDLQGRSGGIRFDWTPNYIGPRFL